MNSETKSTSNTSGVKYLLSKIADNNYAFELDGIREIIITPKITLMPNQPEHQKEIIKLRKNILPLLDLRIILGFQLSKKNMKTLSIC